MQVIYAVSVNGEDTFDATEVADSVMDILVLGDGDGESIDKPIAVFDLRAVCFNGSIKRCRTHDCVV